MAHPLDITYSIPLEREYEAWIIRGIEQYFQSIGKSIAVWAVSPVDEVNWPADESMIIGTKLIGLQMKKVDYICNGSNPRKFGRLRWSFHNPPGQYDLVSTFPEIYYCLPTFLNRNIKEEALSHCLFWRPDPSKRDLNAWYDNPQAHTPYKAIGTSARWGKFLEDIVDCSIGKKVDNLDDAKSYISSLVGYMREVSDIPLEKLDTQLDNFEKSREPNVYLFAVPVNS